uniref:Uncharacterized protein n=1 Tax=Chenopodium quinoa TaxID=63459 RepID=A0A803KX95_CHEQI
MSDNGGKFVCGNFGIIGSSDGNVPSGKANTPGQVLMKSYWDGGGVREGTVGMVVGTVGMAGRGGIVNFGAEGIEGNGGKVAFGRAGAAGKGGIAAGFGRFVAAGIVGRGLAGIGGIAACGSFGTAGIGGIAACGSFGTAGIGGMVACGSFGTAGIGGMVACGSFGTAGIGGMLSLGIDGRGGSVCRRCRAAKLISKLETERAKIKEKTK